MNIQALYHNKPVLITGGAGFIGSHISEQLVHFGAQVTILDDFSTGREENIAHIQHAIKFIYGSVTDQNTCLYATKGQQIIFHCAAATSVPASVHNPHGYFMSNVTATLHLLEAARVHKVARFVLSSSSAVYGKQNEPCHEQTPCHPTSMYGLSKLMAEEVCTFYSQAYGIPAVSLRYFNVYGPRQNPFTPYAPVIAYFSECMQHNKPITVYGDGTQTRDFVHVSSIVEANLNAGIAPAETIAGQVYNCGSGSSISLLTLIEQLKHQFPAYTGTIHFAPERPGDVKHTAADCTKYQQLLKHMALSV